MVCNMFKLFKLLVLHLLKLMGLFTFMRWKTRRGVRILCYHAIWLGDDGYPGDGMFMKQSTFEARLACLRKWSFSIVSLDQAIDGMSNGTLPPCPVVITIDDGWYSTYAAMLPALKRHGMKATLYCDTAHLLERQPVPHVMASYIKLLLESGCAGRTRVLNHDQALLYEDSLLSHGNTRERLATVFKFAQSVSFDFDRYVHNKVFDYMHPEQLREAYMAGLDVQLHTHNHSMQDMSTEAVAKEIVENRNHLAQILDARPEFFKHFCYPSGSYSLSLVEVLEESGVLSSTTVEQAIAYPETNKQFLPRILDGEQLTPLELEAELCGVMDMLRKFKNLSIKAVNV